VEIKGQQMSDRSRNLWYFLAATAVIVLIQSLLEA